MLVLLPSDDSSSIDLAYSSGCLLASGKDLETAVLISLFSDGERVGGPQADEPRAGWWADAYAEQIEGSDFTSLGSQVWTLDTASPKDAQTLGSQYVADALQWLIDDGHAKAITTEVNVVGEHLLIGVRITLARGGVVYLGPFKAAA